MLDLYSDYPPRECVECWYFKWLFGEDKKISGGQCRLNQDIAPEQFDYGKIAEGCPLRRKEATDDRPGEGYQRARGLYR